MSTIIEKEIKQIKYRLHKDEGLYEEETKSSEELKSHPFPIGAEITVPALGSAKFANNIETREKTEDPSIQFGIDYYLNEFEEEYGPTDFEVIKEFGKYEIRPINNPKFDAAYERDRQKSIERFKKQDWRSPFGPKTSKWS